jgi:hypothetical protein
MSSWSVLKSVPSALSDEAWEDAEGVPLSVPLCVRLVHVHAIGGREYRMVLQESLILQRFGTKRSCPEKGIRDFAESAPGSSTPTEVGKRSAARFNVNAGLAP